METISDILKSKDVESHHFMSFCLPPNIQLEDKSGLNEWLERMMFLFEDLKWLLSLSPTDFWKQVLHDHSLSISIDSFLQNAPRKYDLRNLPDGCKIALSRVTRMFFLVIKRMTTLNEQSNLFADENAYGNIIYENYIFDAAKIFDICAVFYIPECGIQNILETILRTIFESQPLYYHDLSNALDTFLSTVDDMVTKLMVKDEKKRIREIEAQDMMTFLYDSVNTFFNLLKTYPNIASVFFQTKFVARLTTIQEKVIPQLISLFQVNRKKFIYMSKQIEKLSIQLIDIIVQNAFIMKAKMKSDDAVQILTPEYVSILDEISQHSNILALYCKLGSLSEDIHILTTSNCVDAPSLEYIQSMVAGVVKQNTSFSTLKTLREFLPNKSEHFLNTYIEKYGENVEEILDRIMEDTSKDNRNKHKTSKVYPNSDVMDDNKEHVALLKASLFGSEEIDNYNIAYDMYEDEYDDTYDSHNIGAMDADSADELDQMLSRRSFTVPNVLRQLGDRTPSNSDDSDNNENEEHAKGNKNNNTNQTKQRDNKQYFKDNGNKRGTEKNVRGRGASHRGSAHNNSNNSNSAPTRGRNVGRGRGRGRGRGGRSHNQRVLADKKRSSGMIPQ